MPDKREIRGNGSTADVRGQMKTLPVFSTGSSPLIPASALLKGRREASGLTTIRKQLLLLKAVIGVPRLH